MSARDDYPAAHAATFYSAAHRKRYGPPHPNSQIAQINAMFDELDQLRAELDADRHGQLNLWGAA